MIILHELDNLISAELFGTLAGLSMVALGIVAAIQYYRSQGEGNINAQETQGVTRETINKYFGLAYFISSLTFFILGLLLTLLLNSLGSKYNANPIFESFTVGLKVLVLLIGLLLVFGGVDALARLTMNRRFHLFLKNDRFIVKLLEFFLPTAREDQNREDPGQLIKSKMNSENKTPIDDSEKIEARRKLADQLKTGFVAALLILWVAALRSSGNIQVQRGSWLVWTIGSVVLFFLLLIYRKKNIRWPKLRWVLPLGAVALLWGMYFLSGISFPVGFFTSIAIILLLWTIVLAAALFIATTKLPDGKVGIGIIEFTRWGDRLSWILTVFVFLMSILLGWTRLWNAGMRGWWMDPLLYLGIVIFLIFIYYHVRRNSQ